MTDEVLRDPLAKRVLRAWWSAALAGHAILSLPTTGGSDVRVFYGGARPGDVGGPLVKVKRLREAFEESWWRYSIVYTLSNAPYLPDLALSLLKLRNVPIVHNQNGVFYAAWFKGDWRARNARMARTYHMANHVFYQSQFCRSSAERFLGPRLGSGEILYNAVDTETFTPAANKPREQSPTFRFLVTGKIDSHLYYRIESTMRGLAEARRLGLDCSLEIAGWIADAPLTRAKALAEELGISNSVLYSGPYSQETAPDVYRRADAYVMTKHNDPCPNTVLEALSCGLPVLYSDSGGVGEQVGASGIAVPCEESWDVVKVPETSAIADAMTKIAAECDALSSEARKRAVTQFDIGPWLNRHHDVFTRLIGERS